MIKFNNGVIDKEVLNFLRKIVVKKLPPKAAFNVYKLSIEMEQIFKAKVNTEVNIFNKYSTEVDGKRIVNIEYKSNFEKDMIDLNSIEHTIDLDKIDIDVSKDIDENVSAELLYKINFLFNFVERKN